MSARLAALAGAIVVAVVPADAAVAYHVDDTIIGRNSASGRRPAEPADVRELGRLLRRGLHRLHERRRHLPRANALTVPVRMRTNFPGATASCKVVGAAALASRGRLTVEVVVRD